MVTGGVGGFERTLDVQQFSEEEMRTVVEEAKRKAQPWECEVTIIPLGISHSVISIPPEDENFLRLNFYSKVRWRVPIDPTRHYFDSKFEIKTTVHKQAEWKEKLTAAR